MSWIEDTLGTDCSAPGYWSAGGGAVTGCYVYYRGVVLAAESRDGRDGALAALRAKVEPFVEALRAAPEIPAAEEINLVLEPGPDGPPRRRFVRPMGIERAELELSLGVDAALVFLDESSGNFAIATRGAGGDVQVLRIGTPVHGDDATERPLPIPGRTPAPAEEAAFYRAKAERVRPLLRCPLTGVELEDRDGGLYSAAADRLYPIVDGKPVLAVDADYDPSSSGKPESQNTYGQQVLSLIEQYRDGWVLDCGSGSPTKGFYNVVHLELFAYPEVDVVTDGQRLPFADDTFDAVLSEAVLEHVVDPVEYTREVARVLKPGGLVRLDAAFLQPYHGYPDHYFNMTRSGLARVVESAGLEIESLDVGQHQHPFITLGLVLNGYVQGTTDPVKREALAGMTVRELVDRIGSGGGPPLDALSRDAVDKLAAGFACVARKPRD